MAEPVNIAQALNQYQESNFNGYGNIRSNSHQEKSHSPPANWKWILDVDDCLDIARTLFQAENQKLEISDKVRNSEYFIFRELVGLLSGKIKKEGRESIEAKESKFTVEEIEYYAMVIDVNEFQERILSQDNQHRDIKKALETLHRHQSHLLKFKNKEWEDRRYKQTIGISKSLIDASFYQPKY
jgi:hypothetical protein